MLVFPPAKINLGLNVIARRADGYHEIESVMVPIPLCDALEIVVDPMLGAAEVVYTRSGLPIDGDPKDDLCMRAVRAFGSVRPLPGLRMHLLKAVPLGAGLGGGSSDGAHTLMLLDELIGTQLGKVSLHELAASLGSDCPFFLGDEAALVTGRGEQLEPIGLDLRGLWIMLVNPGVHVSTAEVYKNTSPTGRRIDLAHSLTSSKLEYWSDVAPNIMEAYVFRTHPVIGTIKERLLSAGAAYAAMSGSGSTVFGLFNSKPVELTWPNEYRCWTYAL